VNELVQAYIVDTQYPDTSGIEHLEMLKRRSELAVLEQQLNRQERHQLAAADARLVAHASEFLAEIARFADLAVERRRLGAPPSHWWWYLDVLVQVPGLLPRNRELELLTA
jgi:hypothetical protein